MAARSPLRVLFTEEDFVRLVRGETIQIPAAGPEHGPDLEVALQDIGFPAMLAAIYSAKDPTAHPARTPARVVLQGWASMARDVFRAELVKDFDRLERIANNRETYENAAQDALALIGRLDGPVPLEDVQADVGALLPLLACVGNERARRVGDELIRALAILESVEGESS